jgi:hypothetical protein
MAYATGNAGSATDLVNAITVFCTANGWTLNSGVLSKGNNHFRPVVTGAHIKCEMGDAAGFTSPGLTGNGFPYISLNGVFPVFYRLFATTLNGADTVVLCVQEANGSEYKYMMFGNIENKVGAWTGGQWMHATYASQTNGTTTRQSNAGVAIDPTGDGTGGTNAESYQQAHGVLFAMTDGQPNFGSNFTGGNSFIRCDIDVGPIRANTTGAVGNNNMTGCVDAFRFARLQLRRQPNVWNGESCLVPAHLFLGRASSTCSRLGNIGHVRFMRMDNYEPGDIITLGLDRWMVLPMYRRDPLKPLGEKSAFNSTAINGSSGQLAYAIKYDGP